MGTTNGEYVFYWEIKIQFKGCFFFKSILYEAIHDSNLSMDLVQFRKSNIEVGTSS